jgi:hypothetical protein
MYKCVSFFEGNFWASSHFSISNWQLGRLRLTTCSKTVGSSVLYTCKCASRLKHVALTPSSWRCIAWRRDSMRAAAVVAQEHVAHRQRYRSRSPSKRNISPRVAAASKPTAVHMFALQHYRLANATGGQVRCAGTHHLNATIGKSAWLVMKTLCNTPDESAKVTFVQHQPAFNVTNRAVSRIQSTRQPLFLSSDHVRLLFDSAA